LQATNTTSYVRIAVLLTHSVLPNKVGQIQMSQYKYL
jgi:hypothetical protein